jgi:hypothetical protein
VSTNCKTCANIRIMDGVKLCGLVYAPGKKDPAVFNAVGAWLNANMDRPNRRLKPDADGCPHYRAEP